MLRMIIKTKQKIFLKISLKASIYKERVKNYGTEVKKKKKVILALRVFVESRIQG
jgi:hypothetical protein